MCEIWTMGEMLVEIMRPKAGMQLFEPGEFVGPFPSGAPTIFIDTVARLKHSAGIFGGVGILTTALESLSITSEIPPPLKLKTLVLRMSELQNFFTSWDVR